jgi:Glycosyltransferase like family 2
VTTPLPLYLIHWNAPEWCAAAAAAVLASHDSSRWCVTVVDNGQDHGPPLETILPAGVRVLRTGGNLGYAGAANRALADWRACWPAADVAVIASHDLQLEPDALQRLLDGARAGEFGILGPMLTGHTRSSGGGWNGWEASEVPLCEGDGVLERDWISGTCMLLTRRCVAALGGFDERFHSYCEDVDLGLRARAAGWKVGVVPGARMWGQGSISPLATAVCEANSVLLAAKHAGVVAAARRLLRIAAWATRAGAASLAPWRPRTRRAASALWAAHHARALALVARRWPVALAMARERSAARANVV